MMCGQQFSVHCTHTSFLSCLPPYFKNAIHSKQLFNLITLTNNVNYCYNRNILDSEGNLVEAFTSSRLHELFYYGEIIGNSPISDASHV